MDRVRYPTYSAIAGEWFDNGEAVVLQEGDVVSDWITTEYAFTLLPEGLYWEEIKTTPPLSPLPFTCYKAVRMDKLAAFLNGQAGISNALCNLAMPIALVVVVALAVVVLDLPVDLWYLPRLLGL